MCLSFFTMESEPGCAAPAIIPHRVEDAGVALPRVFAFQIELQCDLALHSVSLTVETRELFISTLRRFICPSWIAFGSRPLMCRSSIHAYG